jgi:tryptophanyl-tRNA synthetase
MRVLSGTQPSGELHIGNYFGALRQYLALQEGNECLYFIADYHSMTSVRDGKERKKLTRDVALDYLGCGLDPEHSILYRQSDVPEVCELSWILSTITPMGLLERCHAYKDKLAQGASPEHGLFAYPVLMAADILLFNSDKVPVGQDQKQHLEVTRDLAQRFNHAYGEEVFVLPEPYILEHLAIVPGTDGRKMSKSYGNTISMFGTSKKIKKSIMGITTDSAGMDDPKEWNQSVFQLWSLFADKAEQEAMKQRAATESMGYGHVKKEIHERLIEYFAPMRERRESWEARPDDLEDILADGASRAREIAEPVLNAAREASGLGPLR